MTACDFSFMPVLVAEEMADTADLTNEELGALLRALRSTMHARTGCVDRDVTHG